MLRICCICSHSVCSQCNATLAGGQQFGQITPLVVYGSTPGVARLMLMTQAAGVYNVTIMQVAFYPLTQLCMALRCTDPSHHFVLGTCFHCLMVMPPLLDGFTEGWKSDCPTARNGIPYVPAGNRIPYAPS